MTIDNLIQPYAHTGEGRLVCGKYEQVLRQHAEEPSAGG